MAVREGIHFQSHQIGEGEPKIGVEGAAFHPDESALLDLALCAAGYDHRQIVELVRGTVAQGRAVGDQRIVQHGAAVRFLDLLHALDHVGVLLHVEGIDLRQLQIAVALLVVRHVVMLHGLIEHALVHQRGVPALGADHEGGNIRDAHLESEQHQVGLQANVFAARQDFLFRHGHIRIGQQLLELSHAHLYIAHHGHILIHSVAVFGGEFA